MLIEHIKKWENEKDKSNNSEEFFKMNISEGSAGSKFIKSVGEYLGNLTTAAPLQQHVSTTANKHLTTTHQNKKSPETTSPPEAETSEQIITSLPFPGTETPEEPTTSLLKTTKVPLSHVTTIKIPNKPTTSLLDTTKTASSPVPEIPEIKASGKPTASLPETTKTPSSPVQEIKASEKPTTSPLKKGPGVIRLLTKPPALITKQSPTKPSNSPTYTTKKVTPADSGLATTNKFDVDTNKETLLINTTRNTYTTVLKHLATTTNQKKSTIDALSSIEEEEEALTTKFPDSLKSSQKLKHRDVSITTEAVSKTTVINNKSPGPQKIQNTVQYNLKSRDIDLKQRKNTLTTQATTSSGQSVSSTRENVGQQTVEPSVSHVPIINSLENGLHQQSLSTNPSTRESLSQQKVKPSASYASILTSLEIHGINQHLSQQQTTPYASTSIESQAKSSSIHPRGNLVTTVISSVSNQKERFVMASKYNQVSIQPSKSTYLEASYSAISASESPPRTTIEESGQSTMAKQDSVRESRSYNSFQPSQANHFSLESTKGSRESSYFSIKPSSSVDEYVYQESTRILSSLKSNDDKASIGERGEGAFTPPLITSSIPTTTRVSNKVSSTNHDITATPTISSIVIEKSTLAINKMVTSSQSSSSVANESGRMRIGELKPPQPATIKPSAVSHVLPTNIVNTEVSQKKDQVITRKTLVVDDSVPSVSIMTTERFKPHITASKSSNAAHASVMSTGTKAPSSILPRKVSNNNKFVTTSRLTSVEPSSFSPSSKLTSNTKSKSQVLASVSTSSIHVKTSVTSQPESTPKLVPTIFTGTEILVNSTPRVRERGSFTISIPTQPTTSTVTHTKLYTRFSTNETDIPTNKIGSLSGKEINLKTTLKKPQPTITTFWTTRKDRLTAKATTNDPKTNEMGSLSGEETKSKTTQQPSPVTKDGVTTTQATLIDKPKTAPSRTTTLEDRTTVKETTNNPTTTKNRITTTAITTTETSGDPVTTETTSNINQISSELKAKMTASTTSDNMNTKTEPVTTRTATTTTIANYYVKPTSDFMETMKENENFKNYIEKLIEEKILQMNEQVNFYLHNIFIIFVSTHKSQKGSR